MKVLNLYGKGKPVYSLEVFPPRNGETLDAVYNTIDNLRDYNPAFVSVTGGALGSPRGGTTAIAAEIKRKYGIEGVVHFTCVAKSEQEIENLMMEMKFSGVENVLALRGDPPKGEKVFTPHPQGHKYGSELVAQLNDIRKGNYLGGQGRPFDMGIGVGGYPEGHIECADKKKDLENLKIKIDAGSDYIVTQMFYDADTYLNFADEAQKIGIDVPIIPGVMPAEKYGQIKFTLNQMGISIPQAYKAKLDAHKDDADYIKKVCEEHTIEMCKKLVDNGAPGIQFFTMDKPGPTGKVLKELI